MPLYGEGIIWYLLLIDCVVYNVLCWIRKEEEKRSHWLSPYIPLNKMLGFLYLLLLVWVGSALWRLDILVFK